MDFGVSGGGFMRAWGIADRYVNRKRFRSGEVDTIVSATDVLFAKSRREDEIGEKAK
ncbi:hypothetical protein MUK42_28648 [Musa troglodytarum]|uniref:Uncharacterized protein n=1 Tax=Musa troglodytarum TaxID=320322 RepID=A0A9E7K5E8_9LILI|nr:hypothetical protein MUK42_28648 [Musa troglodytarum]